MDKTQLILYTQSTAIAIHQFNEQLQPIFSTLNNMIHQVELFKLPIYQSVFQKTEKPSLKYINDTELYGIFYDKHSYFVVGPVLHYPVLTMKDRYRLSFYSTLKKTEWQKRTDQIPIMSIDAFQSHFACIYYMITKKACPPLELPALKMNENISQNDFSQNNIELGLTQIKEIIENKNMQEIEAITLRTWHGYQHLLSLDSFYQSMFLYVSVLTHCMIYATNAGANLHDVLALKNHYILMADSSHDARLLFNYFQDFMSQLLEHIPKPHYSQEIRLCIDYINHHLDENLDTKRLSEISHLSRSYLCTRFKQETGMPLAKYILKTRIEKAKKELSQTNDSIINIQERNGFRSQSHFTTQFKNQTKMTPKAWRQKFH